MKISDCITTASINEFENPQNAEKRANYIWNLEFLARQYKLDTYCLTLTIICLMLQDGCNKVGRKNLTIGNTRPCL